MATVRLDIRDEVPMVCAACGLEATMVVRQTFAEKGHFASDYKDQSIRVPFCDRHKNHWRVKEWLWITYLVGGLFLAAVAILIVETVKGPPEAYAAAIALTIPVALFLIYANSRSTIKALKLEISSVTLTGVSNEFATAVEELNRQKASEIGAALADLDTQDGSGPKIQV